MSVAVVRVTGSELDKWRHVVSWVYSHQAPSPTLEADDDDGEARFLALVDGEPAAACSVIDYTVARGCSDLRCGGVAGVATLPEWRRSGVAHQLMTEVVRAMDEDGFAVSALYAYKDSYYRKFGYASCGWRWQVKCPQARLPACESNYRVRQIKTDELGALDAVYTPFIRSRSGSVLRTRQDWLHRMGKKPPMVYAIGEPLEAYLWVTLEEFWGEANIGEMAWSTPEGYRAALGLIRSLCSNQLSAVWNEPPDGPYAAQFYDQGASLTMARPTMFRVVSVAKALGSLRTEQQGSFCVGVEDTSEWNQGAWTVDFSPAGTEVRAGGKPGLGVSAGNLAQAVMGQPSLVSLRETGAVRVQDEAQFSAACSLLTAKPVVCMDFF
ncbi:MAG: GNAT family N-acetyltransferase [Armatimonadetes bacterium]|nr:GNAT family N-acetyltransferase [Armatimonadota bacterium]